MDKVQAQQFRNRWQEVEEIQQKEARRATFELRWRKLNAVFGMGQGLKLAADHLDEMQVYQRWAKLKERLTQSSKI